MTEGELTLQLGVRLDVTGRQVVTVPLDDPPRIARECQLEVDPGQKPGPRARLRDEDAVEHSRGDVVVSVT